MLDQLGAVVAQEEHLLSDVVEVAGRRDAPDNQELTQVVAPLAEPVGELALIGPGGSWGEPDRGTG
jgi:hypothetical protein